MPIASIVLVHTGMIGVLSVGAFDSTLSTACMLLVDTVLIGTVLIGTVLIAPWFTSACAYDARAGARTQSHLDCDTGRDSCAVSARSPRATVSRPRAPLVGACPLLPACPGVVYVYCVSCQGLRARPNIIQSFSSLA